MKRAGRGAGSRAGLARYEQLAELCQVMASGRRLMIMDALRGGEMAVGEIAGALGASAGSVSPHLLLMRRRRVLAARRRGRQVVYRLASPRMWAAVELVARSLRQELRRDMTLLGKRGNRRG